MMERQAKDGTIYRQVGADEWTPVTRTAKDGTVYKKVGADDWSPMEAPAKQESAAPAAEREESTLAKMGKTALAAVNPGFAMLLEPEKTMKVVETAGRAVDSVTGAPTRAAADAMLDGKSPVAAFGQQFGENPSKAPTGRKIMEKAGVSTERFRDLAPKVFEGGQGFEAVRTASGAFSPALPFIARHARDLVGEMSPADVTGVAADVALDPTMLVPVAGAAKKAFAGTQTGRKALSAISRGAEAVGSIAKSEVADGAKKVLSATLGPSVDSINQYLRSPEGVRNAKSVEEIKDVIDGTVRKLFDDAAQAKASHEEAKDALRAVETEVKDAVRDANFNFRVNQADVREQLAAARSRLDEAYKGRVDELKSKRAPVDLVDDVQTSIKDLKDRVGRGSAESYAILDQDKQAYSVRKAAPILRQMADDMNIKAFDRPMTAESKAIVGSGQWDVAKAADSRPVTSQSIGVQNELRSFADLLEQTPEMVSAPELKKILQQIDRSEKAMYSQPGFDSRVSSAYKLIRGTIDDVIKANNPAYRAKMLEVARDTDLLSSAIDRFGDARSAASRLNSIGSNTAAADRELLDNLGRATGRDFREPVRQYVGAQRTLKDSRAMERIRGSLPQSADVASLEQRTRDLSRPESSARFVENSDSVRAARGARDEAASRLSGAEDSLAGAESRLEPFKGLTPSNTQGKIGAVMKAPGKENIEIRRTLEELGKMSEKDFLGWIADRRAADQFKGEFRIGSRNVTLWTVLGGVGGGAPGAGLGAAAGALVDRFGPRMAQKTLDAVLAIKGSPTWQGIKSLDLPSPVRSYLLTEYARMASRESEGMRAFPRAADRETEVAESPQKGPRKWENDGAQKLKESGLDQAAIDRLRATAAGREILQRASSLSPKSKALARVADQVRTMSDGG